MNCRVANLIAGLLIAIMTRSTVLVANGPPSPPFWNEPDAVGFAGSHDNRLLRAEKVLETLLAVKGKRTIQNTLRPYDEIQTYLDAIKGESNVIAGVHPDASLRSAAEKSRQKVEAFSSSLNLNRRLYEALGAIARSAADAETRYYLERTLQTFRLAGVEETPQVQERIKALREDLVRLGQDFSRNIQSDERTVIIDDVREVQGLPQDFIKRNQPDSDGKIRLTVNSPNAFSVYSYATNDNLRRRMYVEYNNRGYPKNMVVLDELVRKRHEFATLLGFGNWADYVTADKMVKSAVSAMSFLDRVAEASKTRADHEYQALLRQKQITYPNTTLVNDWELDYWTEQVKKSRSEFDSQQLRPYLPYKQVKSGILSLASQLFGVTFRQNTRAKVWHPSVECWEMFEGRKILGRFYFDMHPRPDKFTHGAYYSVRTGISGGQLPELALVCNLPGGDKHDPGLLEHEDLQTFLHEFGHLLHEIFAGSRRWVGTSGVSTEYDFIEAPSQMLEEWIWDPATLRRFARHYQSGEVIPDSLLKQLRAAKEFGKGMYVRRQVFFAKMALLLHSRSPAEINSDQLAKDLTAKYKNSPFVEGTHFQCSFTHLRNYSALVYTYLWSHVIAKDMFSRFNPADLLDPRVATRYREAVLSPGGSAPAEVLIQNFLGRPFNTNAWQSWLNTD